MTDNTTPTDTTTASAPPTATPAPTDAMTASATPTAVRAALIRSGAIVPGEPFDPDALPPLRCPAGPMLRLDSRGRAIAAARASDRGPLRPPSPSAWVLDLERTAT